MSSQSTLTPDTQSSLHRDDAARPGLATAIILSWKREKNIQPIVTGLLEQSWVDGVVLWDNARVQGMAETFWRGLSSLFGERRFQVLGTGKNVYTYARFQAIRELKISTPLIATVDDDWLCEIWGAIHDKAMDEPGKIVYALDDGHFANEAGGKRPWAQLGWGSVFPTESAKVLQQYIDRWGGDSILHRKADRIFSVLVGSSNHVAMPARGKMLPGATGSHALYRMKDHSKLTQVAVARAQRLRGDIDEKELRCVESRLLGK